jgi:hypothetical protein
MYNWVGFNDGYHITQHLRLNLHWTEKPAEYLQHRTSYSGEGAIVFGGIDYYQIATLLFSKRYGTLAHHCFDVSEGRLSEQEMSEILRS